jgi:hypothetical protein
MSHSPLFKRLLPVALIAIAGVIFQSVRAEEEAKAKSPKQELGDFMHQKLDASNKILEGLVMEDIDMIRDGAKVLTQMSTAEKWKISQNVMYLQFSKEFLRNAEKLVEAAEENNLDRAALRWMDTTMSCIECHRFVRNELVVQETPGGK